jgi:hypothetical protein
VRGAEDGDQAIIGLTVLSCDSRVLCLRGFFFFYYYYYYYYYFFFFFFFFSSV